MSVVQRAFKIARGAYSENFKSRHCSRDAYGAAGLALHDNFIPMGSAQWWALLEIVCRFQRPGVERLLANMESHSNNFNDEEL